MKEKKLSGHFHAVISQENFWTELGSFVSN